MTGLRTSTIPRPGPGPTRGRSRDPEVDVGQDDDRLSSTTTSRACLDVLAVPTPLVSWFANRNREAGAAPDSRAA